MRHEFEHDITLSMEWGDSFEDYYMFKFPRHIVATASAGDGLLYNSELFHKGRAHTDPNAPDRVVFFLTFAESLVNANDTRTLPLGTAHYVRWNLWGHTIDEFTTIDKKKWRFWHAVGLFLPKQQSDEDIYRPWNVLDSLSLIFRSDSELPPVGNFVIKLEMFHSLVEELLLASFATAMVYLAIATLSSCVTPTRRKIVESCKKCQ
jgi:hypothetical protein